MAGGRPKRPVIQRTLEGEVVREYASIQEVVNCNRPLNYQYTNIRSACLGRLKTAYGYKWEFVS